MEIARWVMAAAEALAILLTRIFVSHEQIRRVLIYEKVEVGLLKAYPCEYEVKNLEVIHQRAGALIAHLSIMLALCMFIVGTETELHSAVYKLVFIDMFFYLLLLLMAVVAIKPVGFNFEPSQGGEYLEYLLDELIKKHAIIRSVSAGTLIATVLLMTALVAVAV